MRLGRVFKIQKALGVLFKTNSSILTASNRWFKMDVVKRTRHAFKRYSTDDPGPW